LVTHVLNHRATSHGHLNPYLLFRKCQIHSESDTHPSTTKRQGNVSPTNKKAQSSIDKQVVSCDPHWLRVPHGEATKASTTQTNKQNTSRPRRGRKASGETGGPKKVSSEQTGDTVYARQGRADKSRRREGGAKVSRVLIPGISTNHGHTRPRQQQYITAHGSCHVQAA